MLLLLNSDVYHCLLFTVKRTGPVFIVRTKQNQTKKKKKNDFCEYVEFWAISRKLDILSITVQLKFKSKNPFAHMWHVEL